MCIHKIAHVDKVPFVCMFVTVDNSVWKIAGARELVSTKLSKVKSVELSPYFSTFDSFVTF